MGAIRVVVDEVDASIAAYRFAGFELRARWGPAFAIISAGDTELWISGPGTSAAQVTAAWKEGGARARVRPVSEVADVAEAESELLADGWARVAGPVSGPGGTQVLLAKGSAVLEVFAAS